MTAMSTADINDLPDSDFAYIEPGGKKDDGGKTIPRSLRHYPIHDAAHVRNALARASAAINAGGDQAAIAKKAMPAINAAAKKLGIGQENDMETLDEEERATDCPTCKGKGTIMDGHRDCPDCKGTGEKKSAEDDEVEVASVVPIRRKPRHRSAALAPEYRNMAGREFRVFGLTDGLEVRTGTKANTIEVTGEPIVYDAPYTVMDMLGEFEETMKPGVMANLLDTVDCRFLFNHDGLPLARTTSGTLKLTDTKKALRFSAVLDTRQQMAGDLAIAIERGDVSAMSCGFVVGDDVWSDDWSTRSIFRFDDLLDVSAVTYPASPTTSIDVAARMMLDAPVESRTRVRKLFSFTNELRGGKVLSDENAQHIKNAATALQAVLDNAADGGDDGTQNEDDPSTGQDGTRSNRSSSLKLELSLLNLQRH
jgi:HK97 family phage prohead protease